MLDKKSEQVLKFIYSKHKAFNSKGHPIYLPSDELNIEYSELRDICEYLNSINYIKCTFSQSIKQIRTFITRKGISYLESLEIEHPQTLKGKLLKWIKENTLEIIAIIISILALLKP